jgi:hypothetical protein
MNRPLLAALATLALLALASGCALGGSEEPSGDGLLTRSPEGEQGEMTGIVGGTLELDPDRGCVLLSGKPVVWPAETTLTTNPPKLHLPGGLTARSGHRISGGGGEVPAAGIRETSIRIEGDLTRALTCAPAGSEVIVFSTRGDQIRVLGVDRTVVASSDRMIWASELGTPRAVSDPALVRKVEEAAKASGARAIEVTVFALSRGQHVPAVTLESADPASYMKHRLRGFLDRIGYFEPNSLAFVELVDEDGRFAWSAGRFGNGGMVHPRPDLDQCSPIGHSQLALQKPPPPCPAD